MVRVWVNGFGLGFRVLVWFGQGRERGKGGCRRPRKRERGSAKGEEERGVGWASCGRRQPRRERGGGGQEEQKRERERDLQEKLKRKQGNEKRGDVLVDYIIECGLNLELHISNLGLLIGLRNA